MRPQKKMRRTRLFSSLVFATKVSIPEKEVSEQNEKFGDEDKVSFEEVQNSEEEKPSEGHFEGAQDEEEKEQSPQGEEQVSKAVPFKKPLDYGSFYETSKHFSMKEKKDEEYHFEPQNEVLSVDEGGQSAQN
ncbi:hypothetical protein AAZX31_16G082600 [Glycine max]